MEVWTSSSTGKQAVSMEDGPLAGHGRYSFDKRGLRMAQTLAERNEYRQRMIEESERLAQEAREKVKEESEEESEDENNS